jgi:hypothetical protein
MIDIGGVVVIYVDRKHGNAYYDRYRNNWIGCAVEHERKAEHYIWIRRAEPSYVMDVGMKIIT